MRSPKRFLTTKKLQKTSLKFTFEESEKRELVLVKLVAAELTEVDFNRGENRQYCNRPVHLGPEHYKTCRKNARNVSVKHNLCVP